MIQITNNGEFSDSTMKLTIPINLKEGQFAMAFFYDEKTGKLEGLPILELNSKSISVVTHHFNSSPGESSFAGKHGTNIQFNLRTANIIVSAIDIAILENSGEVMTKFKPRVDDWEFTNYGSFIAPGGHCAGQCLTSMWYFYEKKMNGKPSLFGHYDLFDKVNYDNPNGYKFASVIQMDVDWGSWIFKTWMKEIDLNPDLDRIKLLSFAYSMVLTKEPQFVGIWRENGKHKDGSKKYSGHALIAYGMDYNKGEIYIADPNYPGDEKIINFTNMKFNPYSAKLHAKDDPKNYPFISYHAKSALINWNKIGKRWREFENGTIGKIAPNEFPDYQIQINKTTNLLTDGFVSNNDTLFLNAYCKGSEAGIDGTNNVMLEVYDIDGNLLVDNVYQDEILPKGILRVMLKEGNNKLGLAVYAWKDNVRNVDSSLRELFVDFQWFDIQYKKPEPGSPSISSVSPATGQKGDKIMIFGKDFSNYGEVTIGGKSCFIYSWTNNEIECEVPDLKNGTYQLYVKSDDKSSSPYSFTIAESILNKLHQMTTVSMQCYIYVEITNKFMKYGTSETKEESELLDISCYKTLVWNGNSFSAEISSKTGVYEVIDITQKITGTLSNDGKTVISCSGNATRIVSYNGKKQHDWIWSFSASNLPVTQQESNSFQFRIEGNSVSSHVSGINLSRKLFETETGEFALETYISKVLSNSEFTPSVMCSFSK
jgi:hypothetical protein